MNKKPKVGIGVIIIKDNKVLLGKRKNAHGEGSWSFTGGHLNFNESWEDCAVRETMEETGLVVKNIHFGAVTNDIFQIEDKHYVTIFMLADYDRGEIKVMEPAKCEKWQWFSWSKLPRPLFIPVQNLVRTGFSPFNLT